MKWHIAHRHEIPTAFDKLGQDYESKMVSLQEDNIRLKKELDQVKNELGVTNAKLVVETAAKTEAETRVQQLDKDRQALAFALVIRDRIIEERLGTHLKSPFE
jgi:hypothetical protein